MLLISKIIASLFRPTTIAIIVSGYMDNSLISTCIVLYIIHEVTSWRMERSVRLEAHGLPLPPFDSINSLINLVAMVSAFIILGIQVYEKFYI